MIQLLLIFLGMGFSQVWSSPCTNIDLTNAGGSMERLYPMNQQSSDLCYAYVTAQMIDAYRSSLGIDISSETSRTSPVLLAVENTLSQRHEQERRLRDPRFGAVDGGRVIDTFDTFRRNGSCSMAVDSRLTSNSGKPEGDVHPFDLLMAEIELQQVLPDNSEIYQNNGVISFCAQYQSLMREVSEQVNPKIISQITEQLLTSAYITDEFCRGPNRISLPRGQMPELVTVSHVPDLLGPGSRVRGQNPNFYQQNLDSLDQGICSGQPVAISYCSQMAVDPRYRMMTEFGQTVRDLTEGGGASTGTAPRGIPSGPPPHQCGVDSPDGTGGKHVSLIVGRRVNSNGGVEYRLRNTWGRYCQERNLRLPNCEANGDHWITADQIKANITEIQYLQ